MGSLPRTSPQSIVMFTPAGMLLESANCVLKDVDAGPYRREVARIKRLARKHPGNIGLASFDVKYFNAQTESDQGDRLRCLASGIENPNSEMGCYAMLPTDYDKFSTFFRSALEKYHKVDLRTTQHVNDWELAGKPGVPPNGILDVSNFGLPPLSMRSRTARNLSKYKLPGAMTRQDRIALEEDMQTVFNTLIKDPKFGGEYVSLTPGHPKKITDTRYDELVKAHIMFKDMSADSFLVKAGIASDWPYGRGCYFSSDRQFIIWLGEEDHLRIMAMRQTVYINEVFDRLKTAINKVEQMIPGGCAKSKEFGVITSCPTNIGTGMRASIHIKLPNLTADGTDTKASAICKQFGLGVRGLGGEHTPIGADGTVDISPKARFCISEAEIACKLYQGIQKVVSAETLAEKVNKIEQIKQENPKNIMAACFDKAYYETLNDDQKVRFLECLNSGIGNPGSEMGCYAMRPNDYDEFKTFFQPALEKYHKVDLSQRKHVNDWNLKGVEGLPADGVLDVSRFGLGELSMRIRTARNLKKFPLAGAMNQEDRVNMETAMIEVFQALIAKPEFGGEYVSLTPGNQFKISDERYDELVKAHIMFKDMSADSFLVDAGIASDWPYGRGCYISADKGFIIWLGEEDHLRIMAMKKSTVINVVFDRLKAAIDVVEDLIPGGCAKSPDFGVVTSCPTNMGTGMRASVLLAIPNLTADGTDAKAKEVCLPFGLGVRGLGGEHTPIGADGTVDISPKARFCISEAEIACALYKGVQKVWSEERVAKVLKIKEENPKNIMAKCFSLDYYNSLADGAKFRFLSCCNSGLGCPQSEMGCYAMNPNDYDEF